MDKTEEMDKMEKIFRSPRNDRERKELEHIRNLYKYVYKDPTSKTAFCDFIFFYRKEIAERELIIKDLSE